MEAILAFLWENVFVEGMLIVKRLAVFFDVSGGFIPNCLLNCS
jgi:hypothetical protein